MHKLLAHTHIDSQSDRQRATTELSFLEGIKIWAKENPRDAVMLLSAAVVAIAAVKPLNDRFFKPGATDRDRLETIVMAAIVVYVLIIDVLDLMAQLIQIRKRPNK